MTYDLSFNVTTLARPRVRLASQDAATDSFFVSVRATQAPQGRDAFRLTASVLIGVPKRSR
jgi:hypothetical protein